MYTFSYTLLQNFTFSVSLLIDVGLIGLKDVPNLIFESSNFQHQLEAYKSSHKVTQNNHYLFSLKNTILTKQLNNNSHHVLKREIQYQMRNIIFDTEYKIFLYSQLK